MKVFSKTLDVNKLTPDKFEISTLINEGGKTKIRTLPNAEVSETTMTTTLMTKTTATIMTTRTVTSTMMTTR